MTAPSGDADQEKIVFVEPALGLAARRDPEMIFVFARRKIAGGAGHPAARVKVARDRDQRRARMKIVQGLSHEKDNEKKKWTGLTGFTRLEQKQRRFYLLPF